MERSLLFMAALAALSPSVAARDLVVSPEEGPYKTILEAIADSKEGDSVLIKPGERATS